MAISPNMNLDLPTPSSTPGPEWASDLNTALQLVDSHDHTAANGVKIPTAGLNINGDLPFNSFNLNTIRAARFDNQAAELTEGSDTRILYVKLGELTYRDAAGQEVKLTDGGSPAGATGTIANMGSPLNNASAIYSDVSKSFTFKHTTDEPGKLNISDIAVYEFGDPSANPVTLKSPASLASSVNVVLPDRDGTIGADFGAAPIGSVIPVFDNTVLAGAMTLPTGNNVVNGWMLCGSGLTVPAGHVITAGLTVPNLTDDRFIMGDTAASLSASGVSGTFGGTQSHNHNIAHHHVWGFNSSSSRIYTKITGSDAVTSMSASDTFLITSYTGGSGSGTLSTANTIVASDTQLYTTGVLSPPNGSAGSGALSGDTTINFSNTTVSAIKPKTLSAVYLIRVS